MSAPADQPTRFAATSESPEPKKAPARGGGGMDGDPAGSSDGALTPQNLIVRGGSVKLEKVAVASLKYSTSVLPSSAEYIAFSSG